MSVRRRSRPVIFACSLAVLLSVGCSQKSETSSAPPPRDDESVVESAADEASPLSADDNESIRGIAPRAPRSASLEAMIDEPHAMESMALEPQAMESASAAIAPPALSLPPSASIPSLPMDSAPMASAPAPATSHPFEHLPAGSSKQAGEKFARVKVFYATDRTPGEISLSSFQLTGDTQLIKTIAGGSFVLFVIAVISWVFRRPRLGVAATILGVTATAASIAFFVIGRTGIEKHGVTYLGGRGMLTRGVCEVTVPVTHQRGVVERPSLLRFEFREDQDEHIVLTSAIELQKDDFYKRLSNTVEGSPERDMLVFIHGYNVDFESAVQRTAQIAVDLPFEGVPVCYSWPSQGKLLSYTIDENNAQWTVTHLREFLLELANQSGADSINVVAHSMGNRAMTMAMQQIQDRTHESADPMFDRVVLAAPDVDADRFRRDLAPSLLRIANQVTLYASSDDRALIASKKVHGYPRAGESGSDLVVMPGIETVDVSGIDLSLLGHSYYGENDSMLRDLYDVVRARLPAKQRPSLTARQMGPLTYWRLAQKTKATTTK